jgi:hypothetical protein
MAVAGWRDQLATTQEIMKIIFPIRIAAVIVAGLTITAAAQTAQPRSEKSQQVKADAVTINMPEGITKDQADDILKELKAIHQLLERQQTAAAQPQPGPASDKVKMSVAPGW